MFQKPGLLTICCLTLKFRVINGSGMKTKGVALGYETTTTTKASSLFSPTSTPIAFVMGPLFSIFSERIPIEQVLNLRFCVIVSKNSSTEFETSGEEKQYIVDTEGDAAALFALARCRGSWGQSVPWNQPFMDCSGVWLKDGHIHSHPFWGQQGREIPLPHLTPHPTPPPRQNTKTWPALQC